MHPRIGDAISQPARPAAARVSHDAVLAWMREHLAVLLGVVPEDLDPHENFLDLGVDSVQAMALLEALAGELQITLAPEVFFDHPSLAALSGYLIATYSEQLGRSLRGGSSPMANMTEQLAEGSKGPELEPWVELPATVPVDSEPSRTIDIAIIGMAGRFPGASTLDQFWTNISSGVDSITDVPKDRWNIDAIYDPDPRAPNKSYLRQGGFLDDIYSFAPLFFHLSPREAAFVDPQQRLFLEIAWETIEGAGYGGASLRGTRTGVYVGVSSGEFLHSMITRQCEMASYVGTGNSPSIIPNRVSYHLNLRGPSLALDTACSSSLVAIHLASQSLAQGETDYALAGAVGLTLHHGKWVYFSKAGMLSVDGRCKTFDASANGYVPGEGIAAVLLKPLAAALRDRDTIHGIIRGIGVNQDGRTNGITAPSPRAQRDLCEEVYRRFAIDPSTISYVEAHGTGTPLGDPIEVSALSQAFGQFTERKQFCGIGSLKTNIGHLEPVAGVAGLCKVLLAMRHRQLPPTIHFNEVNPHIHFEETPFYLVDRLQEWHSDGPRRASVSAFSFGGVNAHVVVDEPPVRLPIPAEGTAPRPQVITLAATSDTALATIISRLAEHLEQWPELSLADVAYTLNVGREHFDRRFACVVDSMEELRSELGRASEIGRADRAEGQRRRRKARQPAFVFGRSSIEAQSVQTAALMLASAEPDVKALFDQAEALIGVLSPDATVYVVQVALARLWNAWGVTAEAVAGAGADALAAAVVAGVLSFEDGLRQAQVGDWKVADTADATVPFVPLDRLSADEYVLIPIEPNGASPRRLAEAAAEAYQAGVDLDWQVWHRHSSAGRIPLPTYPFERQYIPPPPSSPGAPEHLPGEVVAADPAESTALERLNGTRPDTVRVEAVEGASTNGRYNLVLEDRDGRVLARLADVSLAGDLLPPGGRAYSNGSPGRLDLEPVPDGLLHALRWNPRPISAAGSVPVGTYVLFADDRAAEHVQRSLVAGGSRVIRVLPGPEFAEVGPDHFSIDPGSVGDHDGLVATLQERGIEPNFVHLWSLGERQDILFDPELLESRLARGAYSIFALIRAISRRRLGGPPALIVASTDGQAVGSGPIQPENAAVFGLMRTIGQDYAQLRTVHVDLAGDERPESMAAQLLSELAGGETDRSVAYRGGDRLVPELSPLEVDPSSPGPRLRERGVYWITGGLGGLGRLVARHLAERVRARLVLSGRTVPPSRDRWEANLASVPEDDPMARVIRDVQAIEAVGGEALVLGVDTAETWQVQRAVRQVVERYGEIHGVLHAAGVLRDGLIRSKELATFREVLRPKVRGTICLERALEGQPLDFIALFSSVASIAGNIAQSDYATANAFLDGFAWERSRTTGRPYVALNWSLWESGGMGTSNVVQEAARARGIVPIDTAVGLRALESSLALGLPQVVVGQFEEKSLLRGLPATGGRRESVLQPASLRTTAPAQQPAPTPPRPPASTLPPAPAASIAPAAPPVAEAPSHSGAPLAAPMAAAAPLPPSVSEVANADPSLREFAEDWLLGLVGPRLGVAISDIDPETPFLDLGIDSIIAGEVALDAGTQLPIALSPTMLLDYPTIAELADFLCESHPHDVAELRERLGRSPVPSASVAPMAPTPAAPAARDAQLAQLDHPDPDGSAAPAHVDAIVDPRPIAPRPEDRADSGNGPSRILALSAASELDLQELVDRYRSLSTASADPGLDQLCRSAERADLPHRVAVVATTRDQLAQKLAEPPEIRGVVENRVRPKVAFLFTGQGAQYQRMAEVLYRWEPTFRGHLDRCDEILRPHLDTPLLELLYPADGRPRALDQTVYTQPITFALDYALAQLWLAWGVEPDAVIGHSVGEYAAACVAGVFSLEDGLQLIARRARLMQDLPPGGAMLAVRADETTARNHLRAGSRTSVAALNGPNSVVLSGDEHQLEAVAASLRQSGVTTVRLGVSHAFHSALMEPVLAPFESCFRAVTLRPPRIPLISNLTGAPIGADVVDPEYWLRQLRQPVRFADGIRRLADDGISIFLEVGPGTTLSGLARETIGPPDASGAGPLIVSSLARRCDDSEVLLSALGQLWARGAPINWAAVDSAETAVAETSRPPDPDAAEPLATMSEPVAAPRPATLFDAQIDHAQVSRTLAELRRGRLSMSEALTTIRSSIGSDTEGAP
jgi:acyl transferase domain-containing protein/NAD(P)-dependent dehydrogenase (short-subunit alcohol dehydrogenase family)/acyl carrier protein